VYLAVAAAFTLEKFGCEELDGLNFPCSGEGMPCESQASVWQNVLQVALADTRCLLHRCET